MNRKMIGSANGAKAVRAGATRSSDRQHRPDQRGHGERQRFGDPQHDHHREDRGEPMCRRRDRQRRQASSAIRTSRAEKQPDRPPPAVEQLLGRRVDLHRADGFVGLTHATPHPATPLADRDDLRPPGQKEPVVASTRRAACRRETSTVDVAARTAELRWPPPPPRRHLSRTPRSGPTPRSQIRMRTRSGRLDSRELDVGASGKCGCTASAAASVCSRSSRHLAEHHALRVADAQRHDVDGRTVARRCCACCTCFGCAHRGTEDVTPAPALLEQLQTLGPGVGRRHRPSPRACRPARARDPRRQAANAVARDLGVAAVRVQQRHARRGTVASGD